MRRSTFYPLVEQINRMPCLEELQVWSPRRTICTDEGLRKQTGNAEVDEDSETDLDDEGGRYEDLAKDEALSLEKVRQHDDAVFLENTTGCFEQLADTINVAIEGNLNAEDSKRILSLVDRPVFPWQEVMRKGGKTPWRVFAVDTTRVLCGSGGTRIVSKVIALSTVWVSSDGHGYKEIWGQESAAAIRTFVDGGFYRCWLFWRCELGGRYDDARLAITFQQ